MNMQDVPVRNRELLGLLDPFKNLLTNDITKFEKTFYCQCKQEQRHKDYWTGERHLKEIMNQGYDHEGFPDALYGYDLGLKKNHVFWQDDLPPTEKLQITSDMTQMHKELIEWLGVKNNALAAYYPPDGFISWHNNANASAYNLIFTWSETGDGNFQYVDPKTKNLVVMQDKPGWQCKAAYFGGYDEPESLFYHSASTNCWRVTVSFMMNRQQISSDVRDELIEEIATEE